jgi:hypothetical protein
VKENSVKNNKEMEIQEIKNNKKNQENQVEELSLKDTDEIRIQKTEKFLKEKLLISESASLVNAKKICEFDDVYQNFKELVNNGKYSADSPKIYGLNAFILVNKPINCNDFLAICMLADIKKNGVESQAFRSCYLSLVLEPEGAEDILKEVSNYVDTIR